MKIRSIRDYIVSEQMKSVFILFLFIYILSTMAIYTAVYYQNAQRAEENLLVVERAVARFLPSPGQSEGEDNPEWFASDRRAEYETDETAAVRNVGDG